jgi:putative ABC transport system permease protein
MGAMSMNVLERTREIGVMRAIGTVDGYIMLLVIVEGMLIGVISWSMAVILAQPITLLLNNVVGSSILSAPLSYAFSWPGLLVWLTGVLVISALASALPAYNASRLTIRELPAYE